MADSTTTNYGLTLPEVNVSISWGTKLNTNMTLIDTQMKTNADAVITEAAARAAADLLKAAKGANSDITSLAGLTTPLSVGQGGTASTTAQTALNTIIGTSEQGDILYYNGTNWVVLHHGTSGQALITGGNAANPSWSAVSVGTSGTFVNGDLSTGKLTVTHSLALAAPYARIVVVVDNSAKQILPDEVTFAANTFEIDLTSYGTLTGTWGYRYI